MRSRRRATSLRSLAGAALFAIAAPAFAGTQQYEVLSASVRGTLATAVNDRSTVDMKDLDTRAWVRAMTRRVIARFPDEESARQFLALVRYESMRAGLDPHLVLAVIDVESKFRKYAISNAGARGYMQVMPFWTKVIGDGDARKLFDMRANLRYGCVILRHYMDLDGGDLFLALGRYNGSRGRREYPDAVIDAWKKNWNYEPPARLRA